LREAAVWPGRDAGAIRGDLRGTGVGGISYKRMNQDTPRTLTASLIIAAARRLFATHGYDGTSVREITSAAGANLGAITYHFGSKQELYNQVVSECVEPLAAVVIGAVNSSGDVMTRVALLVRAYFDQISADEDTGRVMLQAMVIGNQPPPAAVNGIRTVHAALHGLVVEGQRAGVIREGDPRLLSLSIVSVPLHMALVRRALKANAGVDLEDAAQREAAIQHAIRFVREALAQHTGNS
jgi:AcrR family transcriptional regulator